jgi:aspartyl-tRNA synthetase
VKITWHEAMDRFGVDKPDLRFGMELVELTDVFAATEFKAFAGRSCIKGINAPGKAEEFGRNKLDPSPTRAKRLGAKGLVWMKVEADGTLESPVAKFLSAVRAGGARRAPRAEPGDLLLIVADEWITTCEVLGSCATTSAARRCTRARTATCGSSTSRCSSASTTPAGRSPATTRSPSRTPTTSTCSRPTR